MLYWTVADVGWRVGAAGGVSLTGGEVGGSRAYAMRRRSRSTAAA